MRGSPELSRHQLKKKPRSSRGFIRPVPWLGATRGKDGLVLRRRKLSTALRSSWLTLNKRARRIEVTPPSFSVQKRTDSPLDE